MLHGSIYQLRGKQILAMTANDASCKVDRIDTKYSLINLDDRLLRRRKNEDASLRDLDDYISKQILKRAMEDAGMNVPDGKAEYYLDLLNGEDPIRRDGARRELRQANVPIEDVEEDFVSYQTVRKHLNQCLGYDTSNDYEPDVREDRARLGRLSGRAENVTERTLRRLRAHDVLAVGVPEATVIIKIRCGACGRIHNVRELLRKRKCACTNEYPDPEDSHPESATPR